MAACPGDHSASWGAWGEPLLGGHLLGDQRLPGAGRGSPTWTLLLGPDLCLLYPKVIVSAGQWSQPGFWDMILS